MKRGSLECLGFCFICNVLPTPHRFLILIVLIPLICISCTDSERIEMIDFSAESDSTMYYYDLGWKQIMDWGDYSAAEVSYRKALTFDPSFVVGKSVLARLTRDLEERLSLFNQIEEEKSEIKGDERRILDVYIELTRYTNLRDQQSDNTKTALQNAFKVGEKNLSYIVHKYPEEVYLKSEYIEVLHAVHGPQIALDSLNCLITESQLENPFMLGYKAIMLAELERYEEALEIAKELAINMKEQLVAKPDAILADIYLKMNDLTVAKIHADRAFEIDPKNLDASRLKQKINQLLQ